MVIEKSPITKGEGQKKKILWESGEGEGGGGSSDRFKGEDLWGESVGNRG